MAMNQPPGPSPGDPNEPRHQHTQQMQWNAPKPDSFEPPSDPPWKRYLLPGAGAGALIVIVILVVAIIASGGDDEDDDADEIAFDADATATALMSITPTPDPDDLTPTPTPEPGDDDIESTPTPEATPTEVVAVEEPTPTATPPPPAPEPTPAPIVGDFGQLPPADIPSGSPADALSLQFNLDMSLQAIPSQANAYRINRRQWAFEDVRALMSRLEIDGELVDQGGGSFRAEGSVSSIYITPTTIQYVRHGASETTPGLPDNQQLIQYARSWLTGGGLVGADIGPAQVLDRDEGSGRAFILLKPVDPPDIISATPSAGVTVRGDGVVVEASINWPASLSGSVYGLRSAESLWADATQGRGFIDISVNDLPPNFQGSAGTVTITGGGIAYTISGSPQGTQFLVPVAVFSGSAMIDGAAGPAPVRIFVPAAAAQAGPMG
jgi:hypothetical protein